MQQRSKKAYLDVIIFRFHTNSNKSYFAVNL